MGYILQNTYPGLSVKLFWNNFQFLGAVATPVAYYWFGYAYSGRLASISKGVRLAILAATAGLLALIWSDGFHHLFRVGTYVQPGEPVATVNFARMVRPFSSTHCSVIAC